jgi:signal transduction histidine kinase
MENRELSVRRVTTLPILAMSVSLAAIFLAYAIWHALIQRESIKHDIVSLLSTHNQSLASESYLNQREAMELRLKSIGESVQAKFPKSQFCIDLKRIHEQEYELSVCWPEKVTLRDAQHLVPLNFGGLPVANLTYAYHMPLVLSQEGSPPVYSILVIALLIGLFTHWLVEKSIRRNIIDPYILRLKKQSEVAVAEKIARQVAHDIRSPLTALNTLLKIMTEISDDQKSLLQNSVRRINDIANDLLDSSLSKNRVGRVDLARLVATLAREKRAQLNSNSIAIEAAIADDIFISVDEPELTRALSNIINNSIESIQDKGWVKISTIKMKDFVCISVEDNGAGMPKEVIDKLGKELVSYGKTKSQSGYGLGLSHAYEFIERSGGRIEVESKLGIGTQLKIFLPS